MRQTPRRITLRVGLVTAVGLAAGALAPAGGGPTLVGTGVRVEPAEVALAQAGSRAPYSVRRPTELPDGAWLDRAVWIGPEVEHEPAGDVVSVDLVYILSGGETVHVWQTNNPALIETGKDPSATGVAERLGGARWVLERFDHLGRPRLRLARRFSDGVTLAVYGPDDEVLLRRVATSVR